MIDTSLFPKLVEQEKVITLFDMPLWKTNAGICPFSGHYLYKMRNRNLKYCKSKQCEYKIQTGRTFIVKINV